ncbi:hypothetical protein COOONC_28002 [Cooperia oncophora]
MDDCGQLQPRMGTPSSLMHMQQGAVGSPSVCSAPMVQHHQQQHQQQGVMQEQPTSAGQFERSVGFTPQQQVSQGVRTRCSGELSAPMVQHHQQQHQQQGVMQEQPTSVGQFDRSVGFTPQRQVSQGYAEGDLESSGVVHVQQQMMVTECDASPGMYGRQQHMMGQQQQHQQQIVCHQQQQLQQQQQQQRMMGQQQPIMCQQMMVPQHVGMMGSNPQQHYQQQSLQAQWTQQQQQVQQAHFARQPQMMGAAPPQRVMLQRVPYPQGTGMILFESRLSL